MKNLEPNKYSTRGNLSQKKYALSSFDSATPWKELNIAFNWINFDYPRYHGHTDWEILLIIKGSISHNLNKSISLLQQGQACLIGPKDKHALFYPNKIKNDFQAVSIIIRDSFFKNFLDMYHPSFYEEMLNKSEPSILNISTNSLDKYLGILLEAQNPTLNTQSYYQQQCVIVFSYILLKFIEKKEFENNLPPLLSKFIRAIHNPTISPEEIKIAQDSVPYSYSQLARLFQKHMHCTITQYINSLKMNYARELLSSTDIPISQISEELHFESPSHFHTLFKRTFNITPLQYRKQ